jgi:very-short-patch-repair endonuclease
MKNEIMVFDGLDVEVFELNGKVLFNAKDVANCLDIKEVRSVVRGFSDKQVVKLKNSDLDKSKHRKLNNAGRLFLTDVGVSTLITKTRNKTISQKNEIIQAFKDAGYNIGLVPVSCQEAEFIQLLIEVIEPFGYECCKQYNVCGKRVDLYIKDINVAVEYDENCHVSYDYIDDSIRQYKIEDEIGCEFIRVTSRNTNAYNVGVVMKRIGELNG